MKKNAAYVRKLRFIGILFMLPAGILMLFTTIIPLIWNVYISFGKYDGVTKYKFIGFDNYVRIFSSRPAMLAIRNSVIVAITGTVVAMVLGILMALMIYRVTKIEGAVFRFLFYSPTMLPMTVVGLLFTLVLASDEGLLNNILRAIGLGGFAHPWLATKTLVVVCIGAVQGWRCAGTIMMLIFTAIIALPNDIFEESRLEGASYWQEIRLIILPLVRPTLVLAFSMMSMWAFKTYDIVAVMTKGGPGDLSMTAPLYIIQQAFRSGKMGYASAIGIVFAVLIMAIITIIRVGLRSEAHEF